MISPKIYDKICKKMLHNGFDPSHMVDYKLIEEKWDEMLDINKNKIKLAQQNSEHLNLSYLFALRWGITSLSVTNREKDLHIIIFQGLFSTISNTIIAINKLALDGLDYQASSLIRNLYELCFMLLAIIIDPKKRKALFDSAALENEYITWRKYFSFKHLDRTIQSYENKIGNIEPDSFLNTWRKRNYNNFSSYVHNDFASFFLYGFALPNNDSEELNYNLWGAYSTRIDIITGNINALLWYTELFFMKLLTDKDIEINPNNLCKKDYGRQFWNLASFIGIFAKEYYLQIRENESD